MVVFCYVLAIHTDIIMYCYDARESVGDLVHLYLKHGLIHFKTKGHVEEPIVTLVCVLKVVK